MTWQGRINENSSSVNKYKVKEFIIILTMPKENIKFEEYSQRNINDLVSRVLLNELQTLKNGVVFYGSTPP